LPDRRLPDADAARAGVGHLAADDPVRLASAAEVDPVAADMRHGAVLERAADGAVGADRALIVDRGLAVGVALGPYGPVRVAERDAVEAQVLCAVDAE